VKALGLELGPFAARAVILYDETGDAALIVDPGFEVEAVIEEVRRRSLRPQAIVLTHAHLDHAFGAAEAKAAFPSTPLLLHPEELPLLRNLAMQAQVFALPVPDTVSEDGLLNDGDRLPLGRESLLVRHCPGHSPGSIVLVRDHPEEPMAIVGDVLFAGSIGRTDLWGGSFELLERSIREVLYRLPDATRVIPGHGPETTIGEEKAHNPFVAEPDPP
jgi:hydroxyacylglutathione hydrolase